MKKIFAILFSTFLLASGMQVSVDRHFCGGKLSGTRLSVTGKLASCGMEAKTLSCRGHLVLKKRCCEDKVTFYSYSGKYFPVYFKLSHPGGGNDIPFLPVINPDVNNLNKCDLISWVFPPGNKLKLSLSLSEICVYRI